MIENLKTWLKYSSVLLSPVLTLGQGIGAEESQIPVPGNEIPLIGAGIDFKDQRENSFPHFGMSLKILIKTEYFKI